MAKPEETQSDYVQRIQLRRRQIMKAFALGGSAGVAAFLLNACANAPTPTPTTAPVATTAPAASPTTAAAPTTAPAASPTTAAAASPTTAAKPTAAAATPATAAASPTAAATAAPAINLAKDQVFRFTMLDEPNTLDPSLAEDTATATVVDNLFGKLFRYKADLTVEPDIAESYTVSPDGKTYTFKLRDWKWSDGKAGSAKDFEYSIKRYADPRTASPYTVFIENIKGVLDFLGAKGTTDKPKNPTDADLAKLRDAVGVKAVDDKTLQIDLVGPAAYFLTMLPQSNLSPLRQDIIEKFGDKWTDPGNLISNGAFVLDSLTPKTKMVLKKNPNYYGKNTLDRIEITFQSESATVFAAYQNNEIDMDDNIAPSQVPQVRSDPKLGKEVYSGNRLATYYFGFNNTTKPFNDKRVRQAFQMAIDTKTLCETVLSGVPRPAKSFIPPGMPGHQPELGFDFNVAKAKQLLTDAGYPNGQGFPKVKVVYGTSTGHKVITEYVQAQIKQNLGIDMAIENWEVKTYFRQVATEIPPMFRLGWNSDYPHPDDWLRVVFKSTSEQNYGKWKNTDYDKIVDQAATEQDPTKQLQLYTQAQQILVDEAAAVWIYYYGKFGITKPWVKNLTGAAQDPTNGSYFYDKIQIEAH